MIVDEMHHEHPELIKDQYWDEVFPSELPYTIATENNREEHPEPSTARVAVPPRQRSMVTIAPSAVKMDEMVPSHTVSYKFAPPEVRRVNYLACCTFGLYVELGSVSVLRVAKQYLFSLFSLFVTNRFARNYAVYLFLMCGNGHYLPLGRQPLYLYCSCVFEIRLWISLVW